MATPATRWTWLAGDPPTVCRGFLAFVPALDRYVCSVIVQPLLAEKQQVLLKEWVATGKWDSVPIDALFAATYPDFDYLNA